MPQSVDQPTLEQRWDLLAERRLKPYCVWKDAGKEAWGVPFQNPGFKGRNGWVWNSKRGDNCTPRSGVGVTSTEWISVDVKASLGPVHWDGFDCFCRSPCCVVSRAALLSSAELRYGVPGRIGSAAYHISRTVTFKWDAAMTYDFGCSIKANEMLHGDIHQPDRAGRRSPFSIIPYPSGDGSMVTPRLR